MKGSHAVLLLSLCAALSVACGGVVSPDGGADTPARDVLQQDGARSETGNDVLPQDDVAAMDAPAIDVAAMDEGVDASMPDEGPDAITIPDVAMDAPPACASAADTCATAAGCPDLSDGTMHTVTFAAAMANQPVSCGGAMSRDVVLPLTITASSDVEVVATPTGGDVLNLALFGSADCTAASELRCGIGGTGGVPDARVRVSGLMPGTYYVVVKSNGGNPAIVQANVTPSRPRPTGDLCPGQVVMTDGTPSSITASAMAGFSPDPDYGTSCGSGSSTTGFIDVVFNYTLTTTQDVTINISATADSGRGVAMQVQSSCGSRTSALTACASGATSFSRTLRSQAPGTYYIIVEWRPSAPTVSRTIVATVTTSLPSMVAPVDRCPGIALMEGVPASVDVTTIGRDYSLACIGFANVDAAYTFTAPAAGNHVIVNVRNTSTTPRSSGFEVQTTCGGTAVGACVGPSTVTTPSVWQRYNSLTPGATYSIVAATSADSGNLVTTYWTQPAPTVMSARGNDLCTSAQMIPETGGIFLGNTTGMMANYFSGVGSCVRCNTNGAPDAVFRLDLTSPRRVLARLSNGGTMGYDPALYLRSGMSCTGTGVTTVACVDDYYGQDSAIDQTLMPGTYWFIVDGCGSSGMYILDVVTVPPSP